MKTKNFENKYRKAFNRLITFALSTEMGIRDYGDYYMSDWESDSDLIQELVNKEIPMKPIKTKWEYACGKCMNAIHVENEMHCEVYCDNCSQKIDWSDEE